MTGDKSMPELNLKQPVFTYSASRPFTKNNERIWKFRKSGHLKHLYRNEIDKAYFPHDAPNSDSKYLAKRTISDKILKDAAMKLLKIGDMTDIKEH